MTIPVLQEFGPIPADMIDQETQKFTSDFWMKHRVGAMVGASVADYNQATIVRGFMGGAEGAHNHIVGPDVEGLNWNAVMTSPGTNGWNPLGAEYKWDKAMGAQGNAAAWIRAGCPKYNQYGKWGTAGLPQAYVEECWKHPLHRDLEQFCDEFGLGCGKKGKRGKH